MCCRSCARTSIIEGRHSGVIQSLILSFAEKTSPLTALRCLIHRMIFLRGDVTKVGEINGAN